MKLDDFLLWLFGGFKPMSFGKFSLAWLPTAAVTATVDPAPRLADAFALSIGGITVPPVTCLLGLLGVVLARPLVRKKESTLGLPAFLLVSAILLITVQLWILESRPGALFAFVIAIGVGFSGYSLIELLGDQVRSLARGIVSRNASAPEGGAKEPKSD
jgi:hypothetical protein